ncbi:MAG: hypothetical protein FWF66_05190 [Candidatus Bathyarchaeota archaeon]|nr:hypothetical protein [Candidatus Termiticorpusculum sp.]
MLGYELFLKNQVTNIDVGKRVDSIKKIFVNVADDVVTAKLDPKTLEEYGEILDQNRPDSYFKESLFMPSNNLASVSLPNRTTSGNSKKPYVEFYGVFEKNKLKISIAGGGKVTYDYEYNFGTGQEPSTTPVDLLLLKLETKNYFVDNKLLFDVYREAGVITSDGALAYKVFEEVCQKFLLFWKEKISPEELKKFSRFHFHLIVLPLPLLSQGKIAYRSQDEKDVAGNSFEDCFGSPATGYPSESTISAKFFSFNDKAFTINCKEGQEFYQNLGIGNESLPKINLPVDRVIRIAGLEWYFFDLSDSLLNFEAKGSGIYDQLRSNYTFLSNRSGVSVRRQSSLKIICTKHTHDKIEVLLDENLTLDQMNEILGRAKDNTNSHLALESLIIETSRGIIGSDYIAAIHHFINGTYFDRTFLIQRFTCILRSYVWDWIKGVISQSKKKPSDFFDKSQFCLDLLTKNESELVMNTNEEYAYKIGIIAGKYVKFKQEKNEVNNSTKDILTYSKYDRERLRFVYHRVGLGLSLSKSDTDVISQFIKNNLPKGEIADAHAHEDFSYFFYKGVFENLT